MTPRFRSAASWLRTLLETDALAAPLLVAATVSFALLGILLRAGSAVPAGPTREAAMGTLLFVGVAAYNVALILCVLLLVGVGWSRRTRDPVGSALLLAALVLAVVPAAEAAVLWAPAVAVVAVFFGGRLLLSLKRRRTARFATPAKLAAVTFVLGLAVTYVLLAVAQTSLAISTGPGPLLAGLAETVAVCAAILAPFALGCRFRPRFLAFAVAVGALFAVAAIRSPLVPLIATWAVSTSLHLPLVLYVAAVVSLAYVLSERFATSRWQGGAMGLWLLVIAGLGLRTNAEVLLVLVGLAWLFLRAPLGTEGDSRPADATAAGPEERPHGERQERLIAHPVFGQNGSGP